MKYDLMKIDDYLFIIGDLYKSDKFPYLVAEKFGTDNNFSIWQVDNPNDLDDKNQYRILAHRPLNGARYLDNIDVLPKLEDELKDLKEMLSEYAHSQWSGWMEYLFSNGEFKEDGTWIMPKWAVDRWLRQMNTKYQDLSESEKISDRNEANGMIEIFDKAREKCEFTDEDMRKAWSDGYHRKVDEINGNKLLYFTDTIKSLQKPKVPIAFERETERKLVMNLGLDVFNPNSHVFSNEPKTITNSEGRTEWVGKYIY